MQKPPYNEGRHIDFSRFMSPLLILALLPLLAFSGLSATRSVHAAPAKALENNGLAQKPLLGWSSWSSVRYNPTEAKIEAQAQAMSNTLKSHGYQYINMDDFWYRNPGTTVDANGRWAIDTSRFPNGIASVATYIHNLGLKFGIYVTPGIPVAAVKQNTPIAGTGYHAADIADTSRFENNYNFGGNAMYYINYSKPGAQEFINSWANQFASWGVDFLKIDGVGNQDVPDIQAWSSALKQSGRPIYFHLSNTLDQGNVSTWQQNSNGWRIDGDVECYCSTLVTWGSISGRFNDAPRWANNAGPGGWNDMDSLDVGNGSRDGLSQDERQTYMTLWSASAAPLYTGDDLTQLDSYGVQLLTNDEVLAVDQAGHPAHPVSQASSQQVWFSNNGDGSYTVALFNLGGSNATVTANWSDLGFSGSASVHDVWSHTDLGSISNSFSANLNSHASRLLKVVPSNSGISYVKIVNRNSGKELAVQGASPAAGAAIVQWSDNTGANQRWQVVNVGGGYVKIVSRGSGLVLDITGASNTDGAVLEQWTDNGGPNQQWQLIDVGGGYVKIVSRASGKVLDDYALDTTDGAKVVQWTANGGSNQQWQIAAG